MSEQAVKNAICYREDGSLKWATWLPNGLELPETTIYEGEKLWPDVYFGREKDGRTFFVPLHGPIVGPLVYNKKKDKNEKD